MNPRYPHRSLVPLKAFIAFFLLHCIAIPLHAENQKSSPQSFVRRLRFAETLRRAFTIVDGDAEIHRNIVGTKTENNVKSHFVCVEKISSAREFVSRKRVEDSSTLLHENTLGSRILDVTKRTESVIGIWNPRLGCFVNEESNCFSPLKAAAVSDCAAVSGGVQNNGVFPHPILSATATSSEKEKHKLFETHNAISFHFDRLSSLVTEAQNLAAGLVSNSGNGENVKRTKGAANGIVGEISNVLFVDFARVKDKDTGNTDIASIQSTNEELNYKLFAEKIPSLSELLKTQFELLKNRIEKTVNADNDLSPNQKAFFTALDEILPTDIAQSKVFFLSKSKPISDANCRAFDRLVFPASGSNEPLVSAVSQIFKTPLANFESNLELLLSHFDIEFAFSADDIMHFDSTGAAGFVKSHQIGGKMKKLGILAEIAFSKLVLIYYAAHYAHLVNFVCSLKIHASEATNDEISTSSSGNNIADDSFFTHTTISSIFDTGVTKQLNTIMTKLSSKFDEHSDDCFLKCKYTDSSAATVTNNCNDLRTTHNQIASADGTKTNSVRVVNTIDALVGATSGGMECFYERRPDFLASSAVTTILPFDTCFDALVSSTSRVASSDFVSFSEKTLQGDGSLAREARYSSFLNIGGGSGNDFVVNHAISSTTVLPVAFRDVESLPVLRGLKSSDTILRKSDQRIFSLTKFDGKTPIFSRVDARNVQPVSDDTCDTIHNAAVIVGGRRLLDDSSPQKCPYKCLFIYDTSPFAAFPSSECASALNDKETSDLCHVFSASATKIQYVKTNMFSHQANIENCFSHLLSHPDVDALLPNVHFNDDTERLSVNEMVSQSGFGPVNCTDLMYKSYSKRNDMTLKVQLVKKTGQSNSNSLEYEEKLDWEKIADSNRTGIYVKPCENSYGNCVPRGALKSRYTSAIGESAVNGEKMGCGEYPGVLFSLDSLASSNSGSGLTTNVLDSVLNLGAENEGTFTMELWFQASNAILSNTNGDTNGKFLILAGRLFHTFFAIKNEPSTTGETTNSNKMRLVLFHRNFSTPNVIESDLVQLASDSSSNGQQASSVDIPWRHIAVSVENNKEHFKNTGSNNRKIVTFFVDGEVVSTHPNVEIKSSNSNDNNPSHATPEGTESATSTTSSAEKPATERHNYIRLVTGSNVCFLHISKSFFSWTPLINKYRHTLLIAPESPFNTRLALRCHELAPSRSFQRGNPQSEVTYKQGFPGEG
ncbi:MAG: hypothetical protein CMI56_03305 [Parcubacteria group bacterium]|nr:hypothetical protein [Parcubacteria group bacterium]